MHPTRAIFCIISACNFIAVAYGLGYGYIAVWPYADSLEKALLQRWIFALFFLIFIAAPPIFFHAFLPVRKALKLFENKCKQEGDILVSARHALLELPVNFTRIATSIWILSALSFIPLYHLVIPYNYVLQALHVAVITILVGAVSVSFLFYSLEWYVRTHMISVFFPKGDLSRIKGVRPVSTQFKIMELVLTTCALPVGVLSVAAILGTVTTSVIIYLGVTFLVFGLAQGFFIARSLSKPVQQVVAEMKKVRDGDFSARATVLSVGNMGALTEGFNDMARSLGKAEFIKESFGKYVSSEVVDKVVAGVDLCGEEREVTVLFCDIRDFTAMTEKIPPARLLALLNTFLDIMVEAVIEHGGRVDKFIGDSVMAVFGAPVSHGDHALRAVKTGLSMLERLERWNQEEAHAITGPWQIGIGIHSGEVIAGNIGSSKKMEYAVIGDVVNMAARIERLNKRLGVHFLISSKTHDMVEDNIRVRQKVAVTVKGKSAPVTVYEVMGLRQ